MSGNAESLDNDLPRPEAEPAVASIRPPVRINSPNPIPSSGSSAVTAATEIASEAGQNSAIPAGGIESKLASPKFPRGRKRWQFQTTLREGQWNKTNEKTENRSNGASPGVVHVVDSPKTVHAKKILGPGKGVLSKKKRDISNQPEQLNPKEKSVVPHRGITVGLPLSQTGPDTNIANEKMAQGRQRWHLHRLFREGQPREENETSESLSNRPDSSKHVDSTGANASFGGEDGQNDEVQARLPLGATQYGDQLGRDSGEGESLPGAFAVNPRLPVRRWYSSFVFSQSDFGFSAATLENPSDISHLPTVTATQDSSIAMSKRRTCMIGILIFCMIVVSTGASFGARLAISLVPDDRDSSSMSTGDTSSSSFCHVLDVFRRCREHGSLDRATANLQVCPEMDEFLRLRSQGSLEFNKSLFFIDNTTAIDWCSPRELSLWFVAGSPESVNRMSRLQQYALGVLFFSASGHNWASRENWFRTYDHCVWYGVGCDPVKPAMVERLVLERNLLAGTIPEELGLLSGLGKSVQHPVFASDERLSADSLRHSHRTHWFQSRFGRNLANGTWASSPR